jgi:hypothetical protein
VHTSVIVIVGVDAKADESKPMQIEFSCFPVELLIEFTISFSTQRCKKFLFYRTISTIMNVENGKGVLK